MIIRQLFDYETYTYTYLIADKSSNKAALIDPVIGQIEMYLKLVEQLNLTLVLAMDTHVHADHITALSALRIETGATTYLSNAGTVDCADKSLADNLIIKLGCVDIRAIYTPGHTDDSYSFYILNSDQGFIFSGDTLLIRGTGRTDFQNGDAENLYNSLHNKLLTLPSNTIVFPGHDYNGWTQSSIAEEIANNPRLQIKNKSDFVEHMGNLNLDKPKFMDIAVSANLNCGKK